MPSTRPVATTVTDIQTRARRSGASAVSIRHHVCATSTIAVVRPSDTPHVGVLPDQGGQAECEQHDVRRDVGRTAPWRRVRRQRERRGQHARPP